MRGALVRAVQHNCDLADAQHARDASLCTYLLGMRELFRWTAGAALGAPLPRADVGRWISRRESLWDALRDESDYSALPLGADRDAFDEVGVNTALADSDWLYGAGVGHFGAPLFFLAERVADTARDGARVIQTEREWARGIHAPPALCRGRTVIIRRDALRRWLWTRAEAGQRRTHGDAFGRALQCQAGATLSERIDALTAQMTETLVLHELGELRAGELLGSDWERLLADIGDRRSEITLRAVRDLLADSLVTLPTLIARGAPAALHGWFALFDGARSTLAPELAALNAAQFDGAALRRLEDETARQLSRWRRVADDLLARWRAGGADAVRPAADALLAAAH